MTMKTRRLLTLSVIALMLIIGLTISASATAKPLSGPIGQQGEITVTETVAPAPQTLAVWNYLLADIEIGDVISFTVPGTPNVTINTTAASDVLATVATAVAANLNANSAFSNIYTASASAATVSVTHKNIANIVTTATNTILAANVAGDGTITPATGIAGVPAVPGTWTIKVDEPFGAGDSITFKQGATFTSDTRADSDGVAASALALQRWLNARNEWTATVAGDTVTVSRKVWHATENLIVKADVEDMTFGLPTALTITAAKTGGTATAAPSLPVAAGTNLSNGAAETLTLATTAPTSVITFALGVNRGSLDGSVPAQALSWSATTSDDRVATFAAGTAWVNDSEALTITAVGQGTATITVTAIAGPAAAPTLTRTFSILVRVQSGTTTIAAYTGTDVKVPAFFEVEYKSPAPSGEKSLKLNYSTNAIDTAETITHYSVNNGQRWVALTGSADERAATLFNILSRRGADHLLVAAGVNRTTNPGSDVKYPTTPDRGPVGGVIWDIGKIESGKSTRATINYNVDEINTNIASFGRGAWTINEVLTASGTIDTTKNAKWQIAEANATGRAPLQTWTLSTTDDSTLWVALPATGVPVKNVDANNRVVRTSYLLREIPDMASARAATTSGDGSRVVKLGSSMIRVRALSVSPAPRINVNFRTEIVRVARNSQYAVGTVNTGTDAFTAGATPIKVTDAATARAGINIGKSEDDAADRTYQYMILPTERKPASLPVRFTINKRPAGPTAGYLETNGFNKDRGTFRLPAANAGGSGSPALEVAANPIPSPAVWGRMPRINETITVNIRFKSTARMVNGRQEGDRSSLPTAVTFTWGDIADTGRQGITAIS